MSLHNGKDLYYHVLRTFYNGAYTCTLLNIELSAEEVGSQKLRNLLSLDNLKVPKSMYFAKQK